MLPIVEEYYPKDLKTEDIALFLVALVASFIFYNLAKNLSSSHKVAARIKFLHERRSQLRGEMMAVKRRKKKKQENDSILGIHIIILLVNKLNLIQQSQTGKISKKLINAGYRSKDAIFIFAFCQLVFPLVCLVMAYYNTNVDFADPFAHKMDMFIIIGAALMGFKLPQIMVANACTKRHLKIQRGLPDGLDLMMICCEAGLSLAAALDRVSRELGKTYPELAEELALTSIELGFLPDRKKALANLAERVDMPEMRGITGVLIQTEKYGTPVTQALRTLASEFRTQRMLRAEQKAAKLPAIMTVPMIVFILPTLFVVVLAPSLLKVGKLL